MQFIDLNAQQQTIRETIDRNIKHVLDHGQYIMGPEIKEFEKQMATYVGVKHALSVSSGTDALLIPLMAYDVKPGDAIFTTPFTFIATAEVIQLLGATPVFVDVDKRTFNIDPAKLEEAILRTKEEGVLNVKGIIPVDMFGLPADYDPIEAIAKKYGLFTIEDAAQGFGGTYNGRKACSFCDTAATSFFPAKPLGCYGDGGMVFTDSDNLVEIFESIRVHGKGSDKYDNIRVGINGRLDTLQAAILLAKLAIFPDEVKARQKAAEYYTQHLKDLLDTPYIPEGYQSVWAQYTLISSQRDKYMNALKAKGIPSVIYYPKPLHMQTAFAHLGYSANDFPVSKELSENVFSLPMHPYLKREDQDLIIEILKEA